MVRPPRHFLRLGERSREEYRTLFARSAELKRRRRTNTVDTTLAGRTLVLLMEKASTRTRLSFAAAIGQARERRKRSVEKPGEPDAFALAVLADPVHAVVPVARADQG